MSKQDAQLKAFTGIPENAETVKLAAFRKLAEETGLMTPELKMALDQSMPMAIHRDVAKHNAQDPNNPTPEEAPNAQA